MTDDCRYVDASTNALGGTTHIDLHGGSLLVAAANANINCPATIKNGSRRQLEMTPDDNYKKRSSSG
jgi:hypothetical protein